MHAHNYLFSFFSSYMHACAHIISHFSRPIGHCKFASFYWQFISYYKPQMYFKKIIYYNAILFFNFHGVQNYFSFLNEDTQLFVLFLLLIYECMCSYHSSFFYFSPYPLRACGHSRLRANSLPYKTIYNTPGVN